LQNITSTIRRILQVNQDNGTSITLVLYGTAEVTEEGRLHGRLGDVKEGDEFIAEGD
jgi:hypothetical protein